MFLENTTLRSHYSGGTKVRTPLNHPSLSRRTLPLRRTPCVFFCVGTLDRLYSQYGVYDFLQTTPVYGGILRVHPASTTVSLHTVSITCYPLRSLKCRRNVLSRTYRLHIRREVLSLWVIHYPRRNDPKLPEREEEDRNKEKSKG